MFFNNKDKDKDEKFRVKKLLETIKRPNFDGNFDTSQLKDLMAPELDLFFAGALMYTRKCFLNPDIPNDPISPHMRLNKSIADYVKTLPTVGAVLAL